MSDTKFKIDFGARAKAKRLLAYMPGRLRVFAGLLVAATFAEPAFADAIAPREQSLCEIWSNWFAERFFAVYPHPSGQEIGLYFEMGGEIVPEDFHPKPTKPYRDPQSGIVFQVSRDGRHVTATDPGGKLLWHRDPFVEANLCPYRSAHPSINWMGEMGGWAPKDGDLYIMIGFDSSQAGYLNIRTGDFRFVGQD